VSVGILIVSLFVILVGAEAFTNALEHLGERLKISEGVTGSIFAAVGTALPETMVPIVAVLSGVGTVEVREEVGVGAILGAPMMLSTLTLFLMALFAAHRRGWKGHLRPEHTGLYRDLSWFLFAFLIAGVAIFVPHEWRLTRGVIGMALVFVYLIYLFLTIRASEKLVSEGHGTEAEADLYLHYLRLPENLPVILLQLAIGLALIVAGAKGFVHGIEGLSAAIGVSALVLSLLIIPIATELPEKVNSILWIRRGRDTLSFGNVTGAMVFQGSLLPALGIMLTPWAPRPEVLLGMGLTLLASGYLFFLVWRRVHLRPYHLLFNGACYATYFAILAKGA
jgi:cation:H+ antiporter